jgi:hypothetical protein
VLDSGLSDGANHETKARYAFGFGDSHSCTAREDRF